MSDSQYTSYMLDSAEYAAKTNKVKKYMTLAPKASPEQLELCVLEATNLKILNDLYTRLQPDTSMKTYSVWDFSMLFAFQCKNEEIGRWFHEKFPMSVEQRQNVLQRTNDLIAKDDFKCFKPHIEAAIKSYLQY